MAPQQQLETVEREHDELEKETRRFKKQLVGQPCEPAADESPSPSKREFEHLQVKAYRFENAHKIALQENEQLQKQISSFKKELSESQDQFKSQRKELAYLQRMLEEGLDAPALFNQFKDKYPKTKVTLKDIEALIHLSASMVSPITSAQLPDLYAIREQVLQENPAPSKLNEHAYKMLSAFIERVEKSTGDYSHLQRLLAELDRQKLYYQGALRERDEISSHYDQAKKQLRLLGERGW